MYIILIQCIFRSDLVIVHAISIIDPISETFLALDSKFYAVPSLLHDLRLLTRSRLLLMVEACRSIIIPPEVQRLRVRRRNLAAGFVVG